MLLIVWRFFKKSWPVHLAVTIILASAVTVFALYGAYLDRQGSLLGVRIESSLPEALILTVTERPQYGPNPPAPYRGAREAPVDYLVGWRERVIQTSIGAVLASVLDGPVTPFFELAEGSVAIPLSLAKSKGLVHGDIITVNIAPHGQKSFYVSHIHEEALFQDRLVVELGSTEQQTHFLYNVDRGERYDDVLRYVRRLYPGAQILDASSSHALAQSIISANYSPGVKARIELIAFITLAFLSASLLSFLERRKVLAILKAMGLRSNEIAQVIAGEAIFSPLLGAITGGVLSSLLLWWLERAGLGVALSLRLIIVSMLSIIPAAIIGIAIPARFAQVATVNQLLFERPIPLAYSQVKGLRRRWPALEPMMDQGIVFIKLDTVQGHFDGFIFRKKGDKVKQGEVIAVANEWWGLKVREYIAPATGEIVFYNEESGFFGIQAVKGEQMGV